MSSLSVFRNERCPFTRFSELEIGSWPGNTVADCPRRSLRVKAGSLGTDLGRADTAATVSLIVADKICYFIRFREIRPEIRRARWL